MHDKLTPTRAMDELNVERFDYGKPKTKPAMTDNLRPSPYREDGFRKSKVSNERTPFEQMLDQNRK